MHFKRLAFSASLAVLLALTASGCASDASVEHLPFTDSVIRDYGLADYHKQRLQYYTSAAITLARSSSSSLRGIADGKLLDQGKVAVQDITVAAGAPGIVVGSGPNWLAVSFSKGTWLYFVSDQPHVNSPYWNDQRDPDRYYLYAPDWDGRAGTVKVGNDHYQAINGSIDAYLTIDRDALYDSQSRSSTLSGRWLDERSKH